ncbi:MAG: sigma-54-dependent Fis family transcriptional regulator [Thermoanaerobacteraceae bacterium]|nr:sigma-54-dependent Fis family transcriptional regulator [Thermoanaerobacteraceae bacterium]
MKNSPRILIVDDEEALRELIVARLNRKGWQADGVGTAGEALARLKTTVYSVAIFDLKLPDGDGLKLLHQARERQPDLEVVILTGHGTIATAIEAMKNGAYDYLTKPVNLAELEVVLEKAADRRALIIHNEGLRLASRGTATPTIVGRSEAIRRMLDVVHRVAPTDVPVLILGESGTGKELVARTIHRESRRQDGPFIAVNAAAIPENLMESELFGHVRGAFTGATTARAGLVEAAEGGTLFLDEIGEMDLALQAKLLRFLETGEYRRVGDNRQRVADVRMIAATNRNLLQEVESGRFRQDLYYRLNVVQVLVPPLRERREDIPLLIEHFLRLKGAALDALTPRAMAAIMGYSFPGNVRELFNLLERGLLLSGNRPVEPEDIFVEQVPRASDSPLLSLAEVEKMHIRRVLEATGWNRTEAARVLGISVRNLYRKLEQYGWQSRRLLP